MSMFKGDTRVMNVDEFNIFKKSIKILERERGLTFDQFLGIDVTRKINKVVYKDYNSIQFNDSHSAYYIIDSSHNVGYLWLCRDLVEKEDFVWVKENKPMDTLILVYRNFTKTIIKSIGVNFVADHYDTVNYKYVIPLQPNHNSNKFTQVKIYRNIDDIEAFLSKCGVNQSNYNKRILESDVMGWWRDYHINDLVITSDTPTLQSVKTITADLVTQDTYSNVATKSDTIRPRLYLDRYLFQSLGKSSSTVTKSKVSTVKTTKSRLTQGVMSNDSEEEPEIVDYDEDTEEEEELESESEILEDEEDVVEEVIEEED